MYVAFHETLDRYHLRDTDELDVVLLQIYGVVCVPKIIIVQLGLMMLLQK